VANATGGEGAGWHVGEGSGRRYSAKVQNVAELLCKCAKVEAVDSAARAERGEI
jgi:hypothetical protein